MKMLTLSEIEARVNELAPKIGAQQNILPTYGYSEQTARPHVEVSPQAYHYVVAQSGQEVSRYATLDLDQLLYMIFVDVTFGLAIAHAENNRIENQDIRRAAFQRQAELLTLLSPHWGRDCPKIMRGHSNRLHSMMMVLPGKSIGTG